ncbi:hypothetical protein [Polaribacter sp.]|uniref:hypothetical protein n=1 Tax=Polaribacter sp. TaxID=1920175 RepID=UPI0025CFAC0D|nr:hypothetical protein [Polaribacter sp.]
MAGSFSMKLVHTNGASTVIKNASVQGLLKTISSFAKNIKASEPQQLTKVKKRYKQVNSSYFDTVEQSDVSKQEEARKQELFQKIQDEIAKDLK